MPLDGRVPTAVAVGARIPKAEKSDGFFDCTASTKMLTFLLLVCMKLTPYAFIDKYRLSFFQLSPRTAPADTVDQSKHD